MREDKSTAQEDKPNENIMMRMSGRRLEDAPENKKPTELSGTRCACVASVAPQQKKSKSPTTKLVEASNTAEAAQKLTPSLDNRERQSHIISRLSMDTKSCKNQPEELDL
mmetsp:Transcript_19013/g.51153  ORF Transcript_19013/g.51153 Transcript_19013/m.51153 type:complete len:110 (-) Transcript_19013:2276-2605(-)